MNPNSGTLDLSLGHMRAHSEPPEKRDDRGDLFSRRPL